MPASLTPAQFIKKAKERHPNAGYGYAKTVYRNSSTQVTITCPVHGDCLEGLVAGPALAARTGLPGEAIPGDHPVWLNVAAELAEAMAFLLVTLAPQKIVIGGGVAAGRTALLANIRTRTSALVGGYLSGCDPRALAQVIVASELGEDAGPRGAAQLGLGALYARLAPTA